MSKAKQSEYPTSRRMRLLSSVIPISEVEKPIPQRPAKDGLSIVGRGLFLKGQINGRNSLFIDGKFEGTINLPGSRVTIGHNGELGANISAREIVVFGKIRGNLCATERIEIRAGGALIGDMAAARISVEDGAFFKGNIDVRKPVSVPAAVAQHALEMVPGWQQS